MPSLHRAIEGREIFVHGSVMSLERTLRQDFLVLLADVNAGFLKGVDEGGVGSYLGHSPNKNFPDITIAEIWLRFGCLCRCTAIKLSHGRAQLGRSGPRIRPDSKMGAVPGAPKKSRSALGRRYDSGLLAERLKGLLAELADCHPAQLVNLFPHRGLHSVILIAVNLVSMTARSFGTVKSGNRSPKLVTVTKVAGGKDADDGF